jgi:hypothetical protein
MLDIDKKTLLSALKAVEELHFQNLALETLLEFHKVPYWKVRSRELASSKDLQPELRAIFHKLYEELEHEPDLSVVRAFLLSLPTTGKPN